MNIAKYKNMVSAMIAGTIMTGAVSSYAQNAEQAQLFQNYQAMVIVEEYNQHCPMLSRLEAEALNGQIVFANNSFAGNMDQVEKFKKEARIFARRMSCNAPELEAYVNIAQQQAMDNMVNHILLARQIHLLDEQSRGEGKIQAGLLLNYLSADDWALLDNMYEEVKENYLNQATEEEWDEYESSILKVAEENKTIQYLESSAVINSGAPDNLGGVQAKIRLRDITSYYFNLEKTVVAFIEGADADERGFPYSRPANDFTHWTAYRPRNDKPLNWAISYPGCGGNAGTFACTLFTSVDGDVGVSIGEELDVKSISLTYRNPDDGDLKQNNKAVEGPIGSNLANQDNLNDNIQSLKDSNEKMIVQAALSSSNDNQKMQTGDQGMENAKVFVFEKGTLANIDKLHKNDVLILNIDTGEDVVENIMPIHNYMRARNWAYTTE
ncbi:hypothetical protein [Pseudemcibacter aquimaris]|uniref:hypothetical protein n=1 Tax=Pseudemcibacter aquimaris TaxID=2857064 RepID=UPI0020122ED8|nr:hypothetical protein [Pseudemcibacter aquimaris]MCC3860387.1 hypothetical protein [Pseudemcibacter aquimaris]WDU57713.1 hypothetical protein KW060_10950 [Pseudemcibacter aquimaris]